jgi:hypothetical protein
MGAIPHLAKLGVHRLIPEDFTAVSYLPSRMPVDHICPSSLSVVGALKYAWDTFSPPGAAELGVETGGSVVLPQITLTDELTDDMVWKTIRMLKGDIILGTILKGAGPGVTIGAYLKRIVKAELARSIPFDVEVKFQEAIDPAIRVRDLKKVVVYGALPPNAVFNRVSRQVRQWDIGLGTMWMCIPLKGE